MLTLHISAVHVLAM